MSLSVAFQLLFQAEIFSWPPDGHPHHSQSRNHALNNDFFPFTSPRPKTRAEDPKYFEKPVFRSSPPESTSGFKFGQESRSATSEDIPRSSSQGGSSGVSSPLQPDLKLFKQTLLHLKTRHGLDCEAQSTATRQEPLSLPHLQDQTCEERVQVSGKHLRDKFKSNIAKIYAEYGAKNLKKTVIVDKMMFMQSRSGEQHIPIHCAGQAMHSAATSDVTDKDRHIQNGENMAEAAGEDTTARSGRINAVDNAQHNVTLGHFAIFSEVFQQEVGHCN
ncbi:hypothetical protein DFH09DRAFT_1090636 [Mycena vulgaris]|nr:hypothetical protein DFH09DRAFT_1090636 [Mycena vulgaris]